MTADQKWAYLECPDRCPHIGGEEYTYDGGEVCQTVRCAACGRAWREIFRQAEVEEVGQR